MTTHSTMTSLGLLLNNTTFGPRSEQALRDLVRTKRLSELRLSLGASASISSRLLEHIVTENSRQAVAFAAAAWTSTTSGCCPSTPSSWR